MSSNIYEDPSLTMKFSKGAGEDRGQRVERLVDIYDSVDTFTDRHVLTLEGGPKTQKHPPDVQTKLLRAAALVLGLLCVLLGVGVIVLSTCYVSITLENNELSVRYMELQTRYNNLSRGYCHSQETENQTLGNITEWKIFQGSCYYKSTEMKNWTESQRDCQNRGADLVVITSKEEQGFVNKLNKADASWIGLRPTRSRFKGWLWGWVTGSSPTTPYTNWRKDVSVIPVRGSMYRVYVDPEGTWGHTNNGSKRWICEKRIYRV